MPLRELTCGLQIIFVKLIFSKVGNEQQWNIIDKKWPCCTYCIAHVSCFPKSSHLYLSLPGEEASVFKCSVSRETECSRVGKQSFIITLGCNSVLLQFSSPAGMYHTSARRECNTLRRGDTDVAMCAHQAVLLLCWVLPLTSEEKSTQYLTSSMVVVFFQSDTKKLRFCARVFDQSLILITLWTNTETDENNTAGKKRRKKTTNTKPSLF